METNDKFDKIERYLDGEMNADEQAAFDQDIATNAQLKEEVKQHELARDAMELLIEDELRSQLKTLQAEENASMEPVQIKRPKLRSLYYGLAIAAGVLLLIGFFTQQWATNQFSNDALLSAYAGTSDLSNLRSKTNAETLIEQGVEAYSNKDYQAAIQAFGAIEKDSAQYTLAQYALGQTYYQLEQWEAALSAFDAATQGDFLRYKREAEWSKVLTLLAANREDAEIVQALQVVLEDWENPHQTEAQALDQKLKSFWRSIGK